MKCCCGKDTQCLPSFNEAIYTIGLEDMLKRIKAEEAEAEREREADRKVKRHANREAAKNRSQT